MPSAPEVMTRSPYDAPGRGDAAGGAPVQLVQLQGKPPEAWVPSRYNTRARDESGRMIVWNTFSGAISAFEAEQAQAVEALLSQKGVKGKLGKLGRYLADRGFLVSADTDEFRRLQLKFGEQHYRTDRLHLILLATEDCNFRCEYCYENFARGTMLPEVREGVRKLVESRAPALRELRVSWFGGEPLYGWEAVEDLAPFFSDIARRYELDYYSHMTTNGYLLTPDRQDLLFDWEVRDFQITLDGPPEVHDAKRRGRDGSGTFDSIFSNLCAMRDREDDFLVTLRMNYDQTNHPHLERLLDLFEMEFSGDTRFGVSFHPVGKWGGDNDADLATCGIEESREVRRRLSEKARSKGLKPEGGLVTLAKVGSQVCYAARPNSFIVGADGKLMKCTIVLDSEDHNIVGRLTRDGEMELRQDNLALWVQPAFINDPGCAKCHMSPTCQGMHCPLVRIRSQQRPCPDVKRTLHTELRRTLHERESKARHVTV